MFWRLGPASWHQPFRTRPPLHFKPWSEGAFASQSEVALSAVHSLRELIGTKRTLDETPPNFTQLAIDDPTTYNDRIIVAFALNEPGTAYCRATRSDSGETSADMSAALRSLKPEAALGAWAEAFALSDVRSEVCRAHPGRRKPNCRATARMPWTWNL